MSRKRRVFFETREVIQKTRKGYIDLEMDYFQFYNVAFSYVASLSSNCAKDFILWIMGKVDDNNRFKYSKELYAKFNADLALIPKPKEYAESTMNMALMELVKSGIIYRSSRGEYTVNPKLFWSDEVSQRVKKIGVLESETRTLPQEIEQKIYPIFSDEELDKPIDGVDNVEDRAPVQENP